MTYSWCNWVQSTINSTQKGNKYNIETAHPIKFKEVVEAVIPDQVHMPSHIQVNTKDENIISLSNEYSNFKEYLISSR